MLYQAFDKRLLKNRLQLKMSLQWVLNPSLEWSMWITFCLYVLAYYDKVFRFLPVPQHGVCVEKCMRVLDFTWPEIRSVCICLTHYVCQPECIVDGNVPYEYPHIEWLNTIIVHFGLKYVVAIDRFQWRGQWISALETNCYQKELVPLARMIFSISKPSWIWCIPVFWSQNLAKSGKYAMQIWKVFS